LDGKSIGRKASSYRQDNTTEKGGYSTFMPVVGFEHTIPGFERPKEEGAMTALLLEPAKTLV